MLSVGLLLNVLACVIWQSWWPIFVVIAYFLAPIPNLLCAGCNRGYEDQYGNAFKDIGYFLTGVLIVSGFAFRRVDTLRLTNFVALPAVLTHLDLMTWQALFTGMGGGLIVYAAILTYAHFFHQASDDSVM